MAELNINNNGNSENLTVWQRLSQTFGPNSLLNQDYPILKFDKKELLKTKSKDEYELAKLQAQQSMYLGMQWAKIENHMYTQGVYFEPTRLASYYDYESMEYCVFSDTKIATPEGFITIKELADRGRDYEFITYAYDHNLKKVVPAKARNAHYTRDDMTYKITFDDGSYIIATEEHRFLKRDGVFEKLKDLKPGDSMMPFYRKSFYNNEKYNWVYTCNSNEGHNGWVAEHNLIAEWFYDAKINEDEEVHHIDFNGKNNLPENLQIMKISEHRAYHARLNNEKLWANPEYRQKMSEVAKRKGKYKWDGKRKGINNPAYIPIDFNLLIETAKIYGNQIKCSEILNISAAKIIDEIRLYGYNDWNDFVIKNNITIKRNNSDLRHIPWDNLVNAAKQQKTIKNTANYLGVKRSKIESILHKNGYKNWGIFMKAYGMEKSKAGRKKEVINDVVNHKIVSIEPYGVVPVYDLTVPGYKNFATDTIFSHNTPEISAALDIYAEESTTSDENGQILQIYSESKRIKSVLADLFNNVLDINTNLPMWTRNTPIREDSIIPLLDGTNITIKDLSDKIKNGEEVWTYSIQKDTNHIVPGKIIWCDLTRKNSELYRVTLDDGTYIDTTPDHEYMLRSGSFLRAELLKPGQSLMPFYVKISEKKKDKISGYEKVYNPATGKYRFTHSMVSHNCIRDLDFEKSMNCQFDTHHIDFNKLNNNPKNLMRLEHSEHFKLHIEHYEKTLGRPDVVEKRMIGIHKFLKSDKRKKNMSDKMKGIYPTYFKIYNDSELHSEHNKIRSNKMLETWSNHEYKSMVSKKMKITISDDCFNHIKNIIINNDDYIGINKLSKLLKNDNEFIKLFKQTYTLRKDIKKSINATTLKKVIFRKTNKNYFDFIESIKPNMVLNNKFKKNKSIFLGKTKNEYLNHKIVSVVKLDEISDVYCMEVVGPKGENDRHNFPVCGKNNDGTYSRNGVFLSNCKFGDNFVFLKLDPEKGVVGCMQLPNIEIERLEQGMRGKTNLDNLSDSQRGLRFAWKNKEMDFNTWEMAHFRLLSDDRKLPYGTSMLEKSRRIWKQLLLSEDAMLIYRTSRAPERRVFKVFVGNMDDKDIEPYVQRVANKFKRDQVVDHKTGNVDLRFNQMAVDQDYFIPVRDPAAPSPIDTLPGAQNLSEIADIEYIQKKLLTALRVPKAFLGFEEVVGDGKNLALLDIRFARTINRIQKSMLQELNKIAIIHLFLLGFEDELHNFHLNLTNPSTQADLLKIDVWKEKIATYKEAVSPIEGIAATSVSWAKKHILGFSDEEIKLDIQQQRVEKAVAAELTATSEVIKHTGLFDNIDKLYGTISGETATPPSSETPGGAPPPMGAEETPPPAGVTPEGFGKRFNLIVESEETIDDIPLNVTKSRDSLGKMNEQLDKLLNS